MLKAFVMLLLTLLILLLHSKHKIILEMLFVTYRVMYKKGAI
jgi:hypothetical protein